MGKVRARGICVSVFRQQPGTGDLVEREKNTTQKSAGEPQHLQTTVRLSQVGWYNNHDFQQLLSTCHVPNSSALFWIRLLYFALFLSYMSSSYILGINPLPNIWFAKIFSHSTDCHFILLVVFFFFFAVQKHFSLFSSPYWFLPLLPVGVLIS